MKRLHVHLAVTDIPQSVHFYSALFATDPTVIKLDYAKWMLDDPRVNFAISTHGSMPGLDHLGIQVETADELHDIYGRLQKADRPVLEEGATTCCYATSKKSWIADPQGVSWETFLTSGTSTVYGDHADLGPIRIAQSACCTPKPELAANTPCCGPKAPVMDFVFTVCDNAAGEVRPVWPGRPMTAHWGIDDPACVTGPEIEKEKAFMQAFKYLKTRISLFLSLPLASIDKRALSAKLREIGKTDGASIRHGKAS